MLVVFIHLFTGQQIFTVASASLQSFAAVAEVVTLSAVCLLRRQVLISAVHNRSQQKAHMG